MKKPKVYFASQTKYRDIALRFRTEYYPQIDMVSSWSDIPANVSITKAKYEIYWRRFVQEVTDSDALVAVFFYGDEWKGVFVEIGVALANDIPVYIIGSPPGSWINHPLVRRVSTVSAAVEQIVRDASKSLTE